MEHQYLLSPHVDASPSPVSDVPSPVSDISPLESKHKAIIIFFKYFVDVATTKASTSTAETERLLPESSAAASEFLKRLYNVEVRASSIDRYWRQAKENAVERNITWDENAVAQIISSQVKDDDTFDEVNSFLQHHAGVSSSEPIFFLSLASADSSHKDERLSVTTEWIISKAWQALSDPQGNVPLRTYWKEINRGRRGPPSIPDPPLKQVSDESPTPLVIPSSLLQRDADRALENGRSGDAD
ncbi:hypothetical protein HO133_009464 [Letharia lupina]|uniref:Uncharacterized protein n=1 Tax=Letharia lupina TaxID=560253 RepID=A0A8H6CKY6_9LECA|nr:uncharacterized protein HO133_009464 [Letharia lupina]KAF6225464.1 hypothetical protein HO133_009464 [Letharia lupina]